MDGEERSTVITENLVWPNGLAIDTQTDKLYWNDAKRKVIETSELDGLNRKMLMKGVQHPYGLSIMGDLLYWSDWQTKSIHQVNKNTGKDDKVIVNKLDGVMDIRTISVSKKKLYQNYFEKLKMKISYFYYIITFLNYPLDTKYKNSRRFL